MSSLVRQHSISRDGTFLKYALAVAYVESRFNSTAVSEKEAYGLMQVTADAVADSAICGLENVPITDLLDPATNIKYGTCYLRKALREVGGDWTRALIIYNGGYRQLLRYDAGQSIAMETANYILQVNRALSMCNTGVTTTLAH